LTHLSPSDIEHLQTVGKEAQEARSGFILKDDQGAVWSYIMTLANQGKRLDFVLDNGTFRHILLLLCLIICYEQPVLRFVIYCLCKQYC
jgi:hypothetical protein